MNTRKRVLKEKKLSKIQIHRNLVGGIIIETFDVNKYAKLVEVMYVKMNAAYGKSKNFTSSIMGFYPEEITRKSEFCWAYAAGIMYGKNRKSLENLNMFLSEIESSEYPELRRIALTKLKRAHSGPYHYPGQHLLNYFSNIPEKKVPVYYRNKTIDYSFKAIISNAVIRDIHRHSMRGPMKATEEAFTEYDMLHYMFRAGFINAIDSI